MTSLCEECFPVTEDIEILTGPPILPCQNCGRPDDRRNGGLVVNSFRSDPRLSGAGASELLLRVKLRKTIGGMKIGNEPCADNLSIALCSYFENHEARPKHDPDGEHGWGEWVVMQADIALDCLIKQIAVEIAL